MFILILLKFMKTKPSPQLNNSCASFLIPFAYGQIHPVYKKLKSGRSLIWECPALKLPPKNFNAVGKSYGKKSFCQWWRCCRNKSLGAKCRRMIPNHIADSFLAEISSPSTFAERNFNIFHLNLNTKTNHLFCKETDLITPLLLDISKIPVKI